VNPVRPVEEVNAFYNAAHYPEQAPAVENGPDAVGDNTGSTPAWLMVEATPAKSSCGK
jgi:hypothetical protein